MGAASRAGAAGAGAGFANPEEARQAMRRARTLRIAGWVTAAVGLAALIPGAVLLGLDGRITRKGCDGPACIFETSGAGWALTGGGLATLLAGGALLGCELVLGRRASSALDRKRRPELPGSAP